MKHVAFVCAALAVSACAQNSEITSRNADLPGIPTTISCDPEPVRIFSKSGDLIEVKHPILHPSCSGQVESAGVTRAAQGNSAGIMDALQLGPAKSYTKRMAATDEAVLAAADVAADRSDADHAAGGTADEPSADPVSNEDHSGDKTAGGEGIAPVTETEAEAEVEVEVEAEVEAEVEVEVEAEAETETAAEEVVDDHEPAAQEPNEAPVDDASEAETEPQEEAQEEEQEPVETEAESPTLSKLDKLKAHAGLK